jgi:tetratricopeptide (TPR) repeat protein
MTRSALTKVKLPLLLVAVAVAFAGLTYGVAYLVASSRAADKVEPVPLRADSYAPAGARSDLPSARTQIAFWSKRVAGHPTAYIDLTYLGNAFARIARETSDVSYYVRAEQALRRALRTNPRYVQAAASLSSVLFSLHEFDEALAVARPIADDPRGLQALATLGDGHLALGRYREARSAYNRLLTWGAAPGVYSRLAFLADLQGRPDEALALMDRAARMAQESGDYGESLAWYSFQIGELAFKAGRIDLAASHYRAALAVFPDYPLALGGLGKAMAALGHYEAAVRLYRRATEMVPQPDLLAALGDVYAVTGQNERARMQYRTVEVIGRLAKVDRQVYNRQLANFYSDHDLHVDEARRLALAELRARKDVYGYDAAAWASFKSGLLLQARRLMTHALSLGTRDPKLYYHAGMIDSALGRTEGARSFLSQALRMNPRFDPLQAPLARAALDALGGSA